MMKKLFLLLSCIFASSTAFADELLRDVDFEKGFILSALKSTAKPVNIGFLFGGNSESVWRIAQWGSKFSLLGVELKEALGDEKFYENEGKKVTLKKYKDATAIGFFLDAHAEYGKAERVAKQAWPHILVEQEIESLPKISELKSLKVSFEIKIDEPQKMRGAKYQDSLHAAQYVMFLTLQDRNKKSKGYGDYLWFGVPIYDSRHKVVPAHKAQDSGKSDNTGKYIWTLCGKNFWHNANLADGKWHSFNYDMLGYLFEAFKEAKAAGYLKNSKLEDMCVASTNTGWEVPGTFKVSSELKKYSILADFKENK